MASFNSPVKSFKAASRFRIVVLQNYFSVLYPLSAPLEITVLPLKVSWDAKWESHSILDDVFENFVKGAKLFKDREVLRHDYLPENLPHREEQIRLLGQTVAPVLKDARCSNIFIYGKTGTGKTAVTKYVLSHLGD